VITPRALSKAAEAAAKAGDTAQAAEFRRRLEKFK